MDFDNRYKGYTIVSPLMVGGLVPKDVRKKLCEQEWVKVGYSVCFDCLEGRSGLVKKPNIVKHLADVADFFGGDVAEHTFGCRAAQFTVMKTVAELVKDGIAAPIVLTDPHSHYSTNIAAEMNSLKTTEVPHSGYPEYTFTAQSIGERIKKVKKKEGKPPALVVMTHADPYYGNIAPVEEVGKICSELEVPYMVNAAYTGGILPVDIKDIKCDFLTLSAHKSMASLGPLGYLVTTYEWSKKAFVMSKERPDWSGRAFGKKIPNLFGCSIGGLPLISSMLSFEHVKERVKGWDTELKRIRGFVDSMEELGGMMQLGQQPHNHHLLHFETPKLWEISQKHKRKGFFLAKELGKHNITGVHKGLTKHIKISVYGLPKDEIEKIVGVFKSIIEDGVH